MENRCCEEFKFFIQHYVLLNKAYRKAGCGHCFAKRVKFCKPLKPACSDFIEKP